MSPPPASPVILIDKVHRQASQGAVTGDQDSTLVEGDAKGVRECAKRDQAAAVSSTCLAISTSLGPGASSLRTWKDSFPGPRGTEIWGPYRAEEKRC